MAWFSPSYTLGLVFILAVACIWAGSSVVIQHIYNDLDFRSPFLLTYLSNSLLVIYLPLWQVWIGLGLVKEPHTDAEEVGNALTEDIFSDQVSVEDSPDSPDSPCSPGSPEGSVAPKQKYTHYDVLKVAAIVCPLWFMANCLYNYSLLMTSVSSSTIISNLAGTFTLTFSWMAGVESITKGKVLGILACFLGAVCVGLKDSTDDSTHTVVGDLVALLGALGYGLYTIAIRYQIPDDEGISMQLLLGYVGLLNALFFLPVLLALYYLQLDNLAHLSGVVIGFMLLNGMCNNVISDYLWARAVVLTSPTVATIGMSITIPLAMVSDLLVQGISPTYLTVLGACLVLLGFGLVNVTDQHEADLLAYCRGGYQRVEVQGQK
mmetsp:Transcript_10847/g.24034  ORF Transcript_10847/g.24034 Transcript_10847/m.24034 type:complete len:377 (-) Transcript_10847:307-1437(-)